MLEGFSGRDVATLLISVAALALSYYTAMRASRLNRRQYELAKAQGDAGARLAAASAEATREQARLQRDTDIIRWATEITQILSEMAEFSMIEGDPDAQVKRRHELRHRLSASIDVGRLYFPNSASGVEMDEDERRPPAYRGERQDVIDHLVNAYDAFTLDVIHGGEAERRLIKWRITAEKRGFVSEVHEFIDPRRYVEFRDDAELAAIKAKIEAEAGDGAPR